MQVSEIKLIRGANPVRWIEYKNVENTPRGKNKDCKLDFKEYKHKNVKNTPPDISVDVAIPKGKSS